MTENERIKKEVLAALSHPEAEEGLFFHNLYYLHEEDERQPVRGEEEDILTAVKDLMREGKVYAHEEGEEIIFHLKTGKEK